MLSERSRMRIADQSCPQYPTRTIQGRVDDRGWKSRPDTVRNISPGSRRRRLTFAARHCGPEQSTLFDPELRARKSTIADKAMNDRGCASRTGVARNIRPGPSKDEWTIAARHSPQYQSRESNTSTHLRGQALRTRAVHVIRSGTTCKDVDHCGQG
ncbi:hypothetical protein F2Q70_00027226 [Brassica cretica]|uniref:Uncharacterized protein n=1 Tax=Brassica cretica TaxID=69181 RepID=A0A8S9L1L5_BRACR|nr:hypothetical protein F2Q70_00027226 [Brassica cretica]